MNAPLKSPYPYFGGKSRVAEAVWQRFGEPDHYIEPFFGSGAVLLRRRNFHPERHIETVNDVDSLLCNFWRAVQAEPLAVAALADQPINETDLFARHVWLNARRAVLTRELESDPERFDVKAAAWWVWGASCWMGGEWCGGRAPRSRPHLSGYGHGIHRMLRRELVSYGVQDSSDWLGDYFKLLAWRLRRVRVCCGDWTRVLTPSVLASRGVTAVLLDPPYADAAERADRLYACDSLYVAHFARQWAIEHGGQRRLRIALCGYEGEHEMPSDWECMPWMAGTGFSNRSHGRNQNRRRERIWFSPSCL